MSSEKTEPDANGINRRDFMIAGVAGAAGIAAAGLGVSTAQAEPKAPGDTPRTNSKTGKRRRNHH